MHRATCRALLSIHQAMASSMEGSEDILHVENEAVSAADTQGTAKGAAVQRDQLEGPAEVATPKAEPSAEFPHSSAEEGSCPCSPWAEGPAAAAPLPGDAEMERSASLAPALSPVTLGSTDPSSARPSKRSIADLDCLICFNRYSACRLPKLLACQHAFCAVCLKLILRVEDQAWSISCPLCRKTTLVFGGLICSLRDKEDILGWLEEPDPGTATKGPDPPRLRHVDPQSQEHPSTDQTNRVAAKRLVSLVLLVAMLIVLVLPFMYTGLLRWALCSVVALGLIMSGVLCCNPTWNCSDLRLGPPWRTKETHVASVA